MGKEGDKLDGFISQLSRDMSAYCLEEFRWTDYAVLIMINTLRSSDKHEEKLAERLNQMYDAAEAEGKVLDLATIQSEIRSFWHLVKENCELTFKEMTKGGGNQGGSGKNTGGQEGKKKKS